MRQRFFIFGLFLLACSMQAQTLSSVSTRWSDSFVEWEIYAIMPRDTTGQQPDDEDDSEPPEETLYGELKLRWLNVREDFSEWNYELGEESGTIRQKWKDDLSQWELRSYTGNVVTMRAIWSNDLTEWRVTNNSIALDLKSKWKNQFDEWRVDDSKRGSFYLYTYTERDPRDWGIQDALNEEISQSMKMALIFLTVFFGSPKM
ncbi:MAG: hypothetical protein KIS77_20250 [Saprospiraceae bacterium]|nr:hypothetical protein [Saprospiraceae bacterium]